MDNGIFEGSHLEELFNPAAYGGLSHLPSVAKQIVRAFKGIEGYTYDIHETISEYLNDVDITSLSEDDLIVRKLEALAAALSELLPSSDGDDVSVSGNSNNS